MDSRECPKSFSSPEAALLLVSTKDQFTDFPSFGTSSESNLTNLIGSGLNLSSVYKAIQNRNVVGLGQRSRLLVLTKRSASSENENGPKSKALVKWAGKWSHLAAS